MQLMTNLKMPFATTLGRLNVQLLLMEGFLVKLSLNYH
jgi:hypothetical protein